MRSWVNPDVGKPLVYSGTRIGHAASIPFVGFAEAFVLAAAKRAGVKPHRVRPGVEAVRKEIGLDYALASRRLFVDKAEILIAYATKPDPAHPEDLTVARNKQIQMTETVRDQLELITYGSDDLASMVQLPIFKKAKVVVDPVEAFGEPIVQRTGTRIRDVLALFWAEEEIRDIAYDFDLETEEVEDIIRAQTKPASD